MLAWVSERIDPPSWDDLATASITNEMPQSTEIVQLSCPDTMPNFGSASLVFIGRHVIASSAISADLIISDNL